MDSDDDNSSADTGETVGEHMAKSGLGSNYERRMQNRGSSGYSSGYSSRSGNYSSRGDDDSFDNSRDDSDSISVRGARAGSTVIIKPSPGNTVSTEHWFIAYWRPAAAWTYLIICLFDFLAAPIFFAWYAEATHTTLVMWRPLTTAGGSIFHLAFGAILGIYVYGRTQEKLANINDT